jgi:hypothetical protein
MIPAADAIESIWLENFWIPSTIVLFESRLKIPTKAFLADRLS